MPRELFPSQCSPYNVNVKAYNRVDVSDAVSKEVPTGIIDNVFVDSKDAY